MSEREVPKAGLFSRLSEKGRLIKAGASVVFVVVGYFVGVWVRLERGMGDASIQVAEPALAYEGTKEGDEVALTLTDRFRDDFMHGLARVYFERSDELPPPYVSAGQVDTTNNWSFELTWKGVARNRSRTDPLFVSAVDVRVSFRESLPFPWPTLPVTPGVRVVASLTTLEGTDVGVGPALNVRWEVSNETLGALVSGETPMLYHDSFGGKFASTSVCERSGAPYFLQNVEQGWHELYLQIPARDSADLRFFEHEGQWYERILSVDRLSEITPTASDDHLDTRVEFESLVGEPTVIEEVITIASTFVLFERREDLLEWDPRVGRLCPLPTLPDVESVPQGLDFLLAVIPPTFTGLGDLTRPSGVDVLVERWHLDLADLDEEESVRVGTTPDVFLNPRGAMSLYLDVDRPRNGTYEIEWLVNGEIVERTTLEALVPNALRFDPQRHSAWFRADSTPQR